MVNQHQTTIKPTGCLGIPLQTSLASLKPLLFSKIRRLHPQARFWKTKTSDGTLIIYLFIFLGGVTVSCGSIYLYMMNFEHVVLLTKFAWIVSSTKANIQYS